MQYREIIKEAWNFTQENKKLMMWYAFIPALLSTIFSVGYFTYQYFAFESSGLFSEEKHSFLMDLIRAIIGFFKSNTDLLLPSLIAAIIFGIIYLFYPTIAQGALIQMIARKRNNQHVTMMSGISYGLKSFLPLFEYHLIMRAFTIGAILTEGAFVLRNLGTGAFKIMLPLLLFFLLIGAILSLLFTYTELYIVIDKDKVFSSMKSSTGLVVDHWQHTILILILLMIIGLRIIFNIIIVLIIPALIFGAVGLFASATLGVIGYTIAGIIAVIGLYFAAYLGGILTVFGTSVWTFTFLELTKEGETSAREEAASLAANS